MGWGVCVESSLHYNGEKYPSMLLTACSWSHKIFATQLPCSTPINLQLLRNTQAE